MDRKESDSRSLRPKFEQGDKRMYKGQAWVVAGWTTPPLGLYCIVPFPSMDVKQSKSVPMIVFDKESTELTGMVGAIFGD